MTGPGPSAQETFVPVDPDSPFIAELHRRFKRQSPQVPWYSCDPRQYPHRRRVRSSARTSGRSGANAAATASPKAWADIASADSLARRPTQRPQTAQTVQTATTTTEPNAPVTDDATSLSNSLAGLDMVSGSTTTASTTTTSPRSSIATPVAVHATPAIPENRPRKPLGEVLQTHRYTSELEAQQVRGLVNQGNVCFMNSVLQVLTHCAPFYTLIMAVGTQVQHKIVSDTPILDSLVDFIAEFSTQKSRSAYSADLFYNVICRHPRFKHLQRGRQEDAQEFLGYLLECLDEEFLKAAPNVAAVEAEPSDESDSWVEVGKKNRPLQSRVAGKAGVSTPITRIFGGQFKSVLSMPPQARTAPSITYDPFQHVQLDISDDHVASIEDALAAMCAPETIVYPTPKGPVKATKQVVFDRLPQVLTVHLKRFTYLLDGWGIDDVQKITKPVGFGPQLAIGCSDGSTHNYRLFAVVYHHGPSATVGHYTVDVRSGDGWTAVDDIVLDKIGQPAASTADGSAPSSKTAYLLFYELVD